MRGTGPDPAAGQRRELLLRTVQAHPGETKSALASRLDWPWGTLCHHLGVLVAHGLLREVGDGRKVRLYLPGQDDRVDAVTRILQDSAATLIAGYVADRRQATLAEVVADLGVSRKVARTRLAWLLRANVIENIGLGWPRYRATPRPAGQFRLLATEGSALAVPPKAG